MKQKVVIALVTFAVIAIGSAGLAALSKTPAPSKAWSVIHVDPNAVAPVQDQTPVIYSPVRPTAASALVTIPNNPDVAMTTATNTTQSENSVFVSPTNPQIVLNSNNSSDWPVSKIFGADYWVSTNGGSTWTGSTAGAGGANSGDPATAIDRNGRMYIGYISSSGGMGASYSTDNGSTWTARTVSSKGSLDKNHMMVDNSTTSAFTGGVYEAWTNFKAGDPNVNDIELSRSTDAGVTWSSAVNISNAINAGSHNQGVNIQTGPNGEVYATWAVYDSWPADENALGFAKSTDGGVTWAAATRIISNIRGVRITGLGGSKTMRVASFPSMAVNQQTGNIYVVWPNIGVPGVNTGDADVYMISSTNGGSTWSTPTRVNQDTQGNGKDQWHAWIACDPVTGDVSCIFYDSRNFTSNNAAETFVAVSQDAGSTWSDGKVSDFSWSADGIVGFSGNYAGDYIGISANNGNVYPVWGDDHSGNMLTYVSPFTLTSGPVAPVAEFVGSPTSGCAPLTVNFTDQSTGSPTSWSWTFGDGGTSTLQNPSYAYAAAGSYTVALTATNAQGSSTNTKTNYITVSAVAPTADFSGTPTSGVAPLAVNFTDLSTGGPTSWSWTFGDGGTSTAQNPSHNYMAAGTYTVALTATNGCGLSTNTKSGYITVTAPPTPEIYVSYQNAGRISIGVNRRGIDTVEVRLVSDNSLVSGASVTASYSGPSSGTATGTTGTNGRVVLQTGNVKNPVGQWCFTVTNLTKSGYVWNSSAPGSDNVECENDKLNSGNQDQRSIAGAPDLRAGNADISSVYPNPFNAGTNISFTLSEGGNVTLAVYDVLGREVRQLVSGYYPEGPHTVAFDAADDHGAHLASGMYFYRLTTPGFSETKKMVLLK
ncbi:MAG: PKD domain-containing protein [candidate division Zixibacteria bacterium]|nr:PKD domain-containing protein [candidate division Zixibacteria bacterium]